MSDIIKTIPITPDQIAAAEIHARITEGADAEDPAVRTAEPSLETDSDTFNEVASHSDKGTEIVLNVKTIPTDLLGGTMQFPKDFLNALKNLFTKAEDFLTPFISAFATDAGKSLLAMAVTYVAQVGQDPTLITNSDKRNAALKALEEQALAAGIKASETALLNALQAAYTHMNPDKATVTTV